MPVLRGAMLALAACAVAAGAAGASTDGSSPPAARAAAVTIAVSNQKPVYLQALQALPAASGPAAPIAYPDDASVAEAASAAVSVAVQSASVDITQLSLFGGEITADAVAARADSGSIDPFAGSTLSNLVVLGTPVDAVPNMRLQLGDWGHMIVLEQQATPVKDALVALDVFVDSDHDGVAAGSRVLVGDAEAWTPQKAAQAAPKRTAVPVRPAHLNGPNRSAGPTSADLVPPEPNQGKNVLQGIVLPPPSVTPRLTAGGYVFPVYGPSGYSDSFGAPRADVTYHHGDDIFAPLGAPVLAVADGTVFSVGWNDIGGNRLWLRDGQGNEFYYAHLSAFSTLAVNGAHVRAGTVLGFVGNTGDAEGSPTHLHFEVHPVALLFLGYDGAVDPTPYLDAWRHLQDIRIAAAVWAPTVAPTSRAPIPGAILLQASDISTANGLEPASLRRAFGR
jgi:murein DD-endopeptidase MepM/ murein hydrolase activator NlpD